MPPTSRTVIGFLSCSSSEWKNANLLCRSLLATESGLALSAISLSINVHVVLNLVAMITASRYYSKSRNAISKKIADKNMTRAFATCSMKSKKVMKIARW